MNFKRSFFNHLSLAVTVFQQYIKLVVYFINELVILSDLGKSHYPPLPCFPVSPLLDLWITSSGKVPSREADDLTPILAQLTLLCFQVCHLNSPGFICYLQEEGKLKIPKISFHFNILSFSERINTSIFLEQLQLNSQCHKYIFMRKKELILVHCLITFSS